VFREDLVQQDLQQLCLGLFQSVNIALKGNAKSVIYKLLEIPTQAVNVGGGYNAKTVEFFGTVTIKTTM